MKLMRDFGCGTLSTWLRQVVDELEHIHEVYSWWCWYILMRNSLWVVDTWLVHTWHMVGCTCLWYKLIIGWCMVEELVYGTGWLQVGVWLMHLFMVQVDYRLIHGWCMVQIYWYRFTTVYLTVIVWQWFHHSTSTSGWQDGARTGGCSQRT